MARPLLELLPPMGFKAAMAHGHIHRIRDSDKKLKVDLDQGVANYMMWDIDNWSIETLFAFSHPVVMSDSRIKKLKAA